MNTNFYGQPAYGAYKAEMPGQPGYSLLSGQFSGMTLQQ